MRNVHGRYAFLATMTLAASILALWSVPGEPILQGREGRVASPLVGATTMARPAHDQAFNWLTFSLSRAGAEPAIRRGRAAAADPRSGACDADPGGNDTILPQACRNTATAGTPNLRDR